MRFRSFTGPRGTVFSWGIDGEDPAKVAVFTQSATLGVLSGRHGWHQLAPLDDLLAFARHIARAPGPDDGTPGQTYARVYPRKPRRQGAE
jgi:hypothetical protein